MPLRIGSDTTSTPLPEGRKGSWETTSSSEATPTRTRLGRYEILDVLGSGSMGAVFKARDPQLGRLVAVKTIRLAPCAAEDEAEFRTRLVREAEAAARLTHPGIVTVFDLGQDENNEPYFVMEYVPGQPLDKLIKAKAVDLDAAIDIAWQIALALDYAHKQGIVHRDIKPANIIITEDGRAKITDFGIAKLDISQITMPGLMLGTPAYMAPEQLIGGAVDGRADLFSLGVSLYIMATGQRPFQTEEEDPDTVLLRMLNPDPVPASDVNPKLPKGLAHILRRALAKKPADRYQTGMVMAMDLEDLQAGRMPRTFGPDTAQVTKPLSGGPKPAKKIAARKLLPFRHMSEVKLRLKHAVRSPNAQLVLAVVVVVIASVVVFQAARRLHDASTFNSASVTTAPLPVAKKFSVPSAPADSDAGVKPAAKPVVPRAKKKPAPQPAKPAVEKNVVLKKPVLEPAAAPIKAATLHVTVQHPFKSGNIAVWSDGQLLYAKELTGVTKKRLMALSHTAGLESGEVRVAAGEHVIRVRITSDGFEASNSIQTNFSDAQDATLHVTARKGEGLQLTLE